MTEAEFQSHRYQMAVDPDPDERIVYLLKLAVPLLAAVVNSWGGKVKITDQHLDPWESARKPQTAEDRVMLWAETEMGFVGGLDGGK